METNNIYTVELEDLRPLPATYARLNPVGWYVQPMIDSTGDEALFWGQGTEEEGYHVWRCTTDGSVRRRLTAGPALNFHPFWSPDGGILFARCEEAAAGENWDRRGYSNLCRMDRDGRGVTLLTRGRYCDERPCASPDGKNVVFVSNRSGPTHLWHLEPGSGKLEELTRGEGRDYRPVFSPSADRVAYFTNRPGGAPTLGVMDWRSRKESHPFSRQDFEWIHGPFWLSDGTLLVHAMKDGLVSLWLVELENGSVRQFLLPGFRKYGHGTLNTARTRLVFDSPEEPPGPLREARRHPIR